MGSPLTQRRYLANPVCVFLDNEQVFIHPSRNVMLTQPQRRSIWGWRVRPGPRPFAEFILSVAEELRVTLRNLHIGLANGHHPHRLPHSHAQQRRCASVGAGYLQKPVAAQ